MTASKWTMETLLAQLDRTTAAFKETDGEDLIAHQVLSHGFMEWLTIVFLQIPILGWRGQEIEESQGFKFEEYMRFFYDRFFLSVAEIPSFKDMSKEEKAKLKEEGWKEYLED
ncbi:MAG: hypothetical protein Q7K16_02620 [Candidatus Azambacteria bacterium]|nr:hypothetical protein [Candidatus Azambacteria bacterium]